MKLELAKKIEMKDLSEEKGYLDLLIEATKTSGNSGSCSPNLCLRY